MAYRSDRPPGTRKRDILRPLALGIYDDSSLAEIVRQRTGWRMFPLPAELQDSVRINWHLSLWCNYSCQYCQVLVFHQRSATKARQEHAFDHYTVDQWLRALSLFPQHRIHLKITRGEPFLDRKNFRALLAGLSEMKHIRVGIDTNGYWDPASFAGLDQRGVFLNGSFHLSQADFPGFFRRLLAIRDAGFSIAKVNYVVAPENMEGVEDCLRAVGRGG